jgi:hypothetical protein
VSIGWDQPPTLLSLFVIPVAVEREVDDAGEIEKNLAEVIEPLVDELEKRHKFMLGVDG